MKRLETIAGAVVICTIAGLAAFLANNYRKKTETINQGRLEQKAELAERLDSAITLSVKSVPIKARTQKMEQVERAPTAVSGPFAEGNAKDFAGADELAEYAKLKSHVFLDDEGNERKRTLLRDEKFLKGLESLLKTAAGNDMQLLEAQSQAIDLLIEARANGSDHIAGEVLRSVIEDSSIENEKVNVADRKALAGVKAELLYQWTAQEPLVADKIQGWLPGPISAKIWKNVTHAQEQNEMESLEEVKAAAAGR
jgi:hypothetical protein